MTVALLATPVAAQQTERSPLHIASAVDLDCAAGSPGGDRAGVAGRPWTAPADGFLTAKLDGGARPDWDLALFQAGSDKPLTSSTNFGSIEQAGAWVTAGEELHVQACRREGDREKVPLELSFIAREKPAPSAERISVERVPVASAADIDRLSELGFDVTEDVQAGSAEVVLYSDAEREQLADAGYASTTEIADLEAKNRADRQKDRAARDAGKRSGLPTGRDTYRVYSDYTDELKDLAEDNPAFVREVTIGESYEGRPIQGVEIASNVDATDDGRPVYLNFGEHHAREWPSSEFPMEFAHTLVDGYNASNPRITAILGSVRTIIVPIVNVDGFIVSREDAGGQEYRRKNCRPRTSAEQSEPCELHSINSGVDLNRNYGAYWGTNIGSSGTKTAEDYRGTAPFSEPESEAVHQFTSHLQPTVFISNHTYTDEGTWLRQPGFDTVIDFTPDEAAMKELGDSMSDATGWISDVGYGTSLGYQVTGATEDWNYFAQGTYGYTPEARGTDFHPGYSNGVVKEYLGDASHSGLGVKEAYLRAAERAANTADHSIIEGTGPPGATLRIHKEFETPTLASNPGSIDDVLDSTLTVPANGHYIWHVNPSSRPDVNPGPGRTPPPETWAMTCAPASGGESDPHAVSVDRGEQVTVDWGDTCTAVDGPGDPDPGDPDPGNGNVQPPGGPGPGPGATQPIATGLRAAALKKCRKKHGKKPKKKCKRKARRLPL